MPVPRQRIGSVGKVNQHAWSIAVHPLHATRHSCHLRQSRGNRVELETERPPHPRGENQIVDIEGTEQRRCHLRLFPGFAQS